MGFPKKYPWLQRFFMEAEMKEFDFPWPSEEKGYQIFTPELENDPLILFHATLKRNLQAILNEGFKAFYPLTSVSYAKNSIYCLTHLFVNENRLKEEAVIIVVRFESFEQEGIKENFSDFHVSPKIQPAIIGYCLIPLEYDHR